MKGSPATTTTCPWCYLNPLVCLHVQVPGDNKMAVRLAEAEEAARAERQLLKERVLQIDQLTAEEEVRVLRTVPAGVCGVLEKVRVDLYAGVIKI